MLYYGIRKRLGITAKEEIAVGDQIFSLIRTKYNTLSSSQKDVADYILKNPDKVMMNTLNEIAAACNVSETTVLRFLRKLNYNSYQLFRINLTQELSKNRQETVYNDVGFHDSEREIIDKIIHSTVASIADSRQIIDPESVEKVVKKIRTANRIVVAGVGASGFIAQDMYHKLIKLGLNVVCSNDPHIMNILATGLDQNAFLLLFSHSGESREVLDMAAIAKEQGCEICAVTSYAKSTLANHAAYVLCSSSRETMFRSDAMTSRIVQLVIIDIIYVSLVTAMGDRIMVQVHKSRQAVAKNKV